MGLFDLIIEIFATDKAKNEEKLRSWTSPKGNEYIKKGGSGRKGLTVFFKKNK